MPPTNAGPENSFRSVAVCDCAETGSFEQEQRFEVIGFERIRKRWRHGAHVESVGQCAPKHRGVDSHVGGPMLGAVARRAMQCNRLKSIGEDRAHSDVPAVAKCRVIGRREWHGLS
jgi:hypothetical protein